VIVRYLSELDLRFHVRGDGECRRRWRLVSPFAFEVDGRLWQVPALFWTDFASIPRIVWPIVAPDELGYGPIPHDWGYYSGQEDKDYWDHVFLACMQLDRICPWKAAAAHEAVERFGFKAWNCYRKQGTVAEQAGRLVARATNEQEEIA
jgi:hypothetical protein